MSSPGITSLAGAAAKSSRTIVPSKQADQSKLQTLHLRLLPTLVCYIAADACHPEGFHDAQTQDCPPQPFTPQRPFADHRSVTLGPFWPPKQGQRCPARLPGAENRRNCLSASEHSQVDPE